VLKITIIIKGVIKMNNKMTKKNYEYLGVDFSEYSTAHIVAGSLGFKSTWTSNSLGFRLRWTELLRDGAFKDCKLIGEFLNVYLDSVKAFK
jgi:hypothetical protein